MRETIKGMFLTQRRSKTEAAFIAENIDRYEELFEICMNGDDVQFKKGITELQKAQNEYILQKEKKTDEQGHFDGSSHERPRMSDIHRGIIHRRKWRSHDIHLRLTAEEKRRATVSGFHFLRCVWTRWEFAEKYLKQGTKVVVTGRIQTGSYTNRDGQKVYTTDVIVEEQEFCRE